MVDYDYLHGTGCKIQPNAHIRNCSLSKPGLLIHADKATAGGTGDEAK